MQVRKQQLELDMEQQTGSKQEKEYIKAVYCHPAYLTLYAEYIMRNARLEEAQAGIKIAGRNINHLRYADGEGNGNPLQRSCLENPRDGGAWWAAVYGIAQSRTRLERLSSSRTALYFNLFCYSRILIIRS